MINLEVSIKILNDKDCHSKDSVGGLDKKRHGEELKGKAIKLPVLGEPIPGNLKAKLLKQKSLYDRLRKILSGNLSSQSNSCGFCQNGSSNVGQRVALTEQQAKDLRNLGFAKINESSYAISLVPIIGRRENFSVNLINKANVTEEENVERNSRPIEQRNEQDSEANQEKGISQNFDQNLKAAVEKFRKEKPTYTVIDFVKTLNPSDAGKAVMDKLFNALSAAGQKQIIWNSDITSADKFINAYMKKINDTLGFSIYSGLGPDLEKLFEVIPDMVQDFSSPEDVKDKIENLFQNLNIGSDFSGEKRTGALRVAELIFILTNLSRDKVSIKNIDLKLVARILNTHIFVKEEGKEEYKLFSREAKARSIPVFLRQKISKNYFRITYSGGARVSKENFDKFSQASFLTRNSATGELTPWNGEDRKTWLKNTHN